MSTKKRLIDANEVYEKGHRTPFHIGIADLCDLKELLEDVPTVDAVEVVHGRWIETYVYDPDPHDRIRYKCSICGRTEAKQEPYCNCGAKMDGG